MGFNTKWLFFITLFILCSCQRNNESTSRDFLALSDQHSTWKDYGGGPDQSKFVVTDEINKSNVNALEVAWIYESGDNNAYQFNPIIVDDVMYVLAKNNSLVALDAATGEEIWLHANLEGIARRGVNYWENLNKTEGRLIFQINNYLQAIDAKTGESILSFGDNGLVDLREGLGKDPKTVIRAQSGTPGKIFENLILLGAGTGESYMSTPGYLRAYDVLTGKLVWTFHTIPLPGEFGYDTWPKDAYKYVGGVNAWGEISLDAERGIAYFPLGSPTYDFYGADREGANLFGNCILALDAKTGKRLWHFQTVHHDLWDYDLTAAPQLLTINHDGKTRDVVAVATKHGFLFVLDRESGEPIWPIEERSVPASEVLGEKAWPTQPFPTVVPPISRQSLTASDLNANNLTPDQKKAWEYYVRGGELEAWKARLDSAQSGLFTPLSQRYETIAMPGAVGGTNFGNTASNPGKGLFYVMSQSYPSIYKILESREDIEEREAILFPEKNLSAFGKYCQSCHALDKSGLSGPSLIALSTRMDLGQFEEILSTGRGKMPAFPYLEKETIATLYNFINEGFQPKSTNVSAHDSLPLGPLVASGGAPGGLMPRLLNDLGERFGAPYPIEAGGLPPRLYSEGYGLGHPYLIPPPWSEIMAYDLNKGTIKWKVPLGKSLGGENTGLPGGSQGNGMIITSSGLVFSTAHDSKIYAFDAETGEELWSGELPMESKGLPSMYSVKGKHYLVVNATIPKSGYERSPKTGEDKISKTKGGYVVFTLPQDLK
jgi:quinoprotein glucose dehydrogenase